MEHSERGGALEIVRCEGIMVSDCILTDSRYRDVWLEGACSSQVSGLIVRRSSETKPYPAITESGQSKGKHDCQ